MGGGEQEVAGAVDEAEVGDGARIAGCVLEGVEDVDKKEARREAVAVMVGTVETEEPKSEVVDRGEGGHRGKAEKRGRNELRLAAEQVVLDAIPSVVTSAEHTPAGRLETAGSGPPVPEHRKVGMADPGGSKLEGGENGIADPSRKNPGEAREAPSG